MVGCCSLGKTARHNKREAGKVQVTLEAHKRVRLCIKASRWAAAQLVRHKDQARHHQHRRLIDQLPDGQNEKANTEAPSQVAELLNRARRSLVCRIGVLTLP